MAYSPQAHSLHLCRLDPPPRPCLTVHRWSHHHGCRCHLRRAGIHPIHRAAAEHERGRCWLGWGAGLEPELWGESSVMQLLWYWWFASGKYGKVCFGGHSCIHVTQTGGIVQGLGFLFSSTRYIHCKVVSSAPSIVIPNDTS